MWISVLGGGKARCRERYGECGEVGGGVRNVGERCGRVYGMSVGKCVGGVEGGMGKMWQSVWSESGGCGKTCWVVGERYEGR